MFMLTGNAYDYTIYLGCDCNDPVRTTVDLNDDGYHFAAVLQGRPGTGKVIFSRWFTPEVTNA